MLRPLTCLALLIPMAACTQGVDSDIDCSNGQCDNKPAEALCEVKTESGILDMELEYLPQVIACENPRGGPAALRAMAISSRSFVHHVLSWKKSISDSEWDQVFGCGFKPSQDIIDAVEATSGMMLMHHNEVIAGMHAAGALQDPPTCTGGTVEEHAVKTEHRITYNKGLRGDQVKKSSLGSSTSTANRGAMSQNGANCLAEVLPQEHPEWSTQEVTMEILRFYYGEDIEVVRAVGECVLDSGDIPTTSSGIGESCDTDIQCAEAVGDIAASCEHWFLTTTDTLYGYCTIDCFGDCPTGNACVQFDSGPRCAPEPSFRNANCGDLDGTTVRVIEAVGTGNDVEVVCVPPDMGTTCRVPSGDGELKGECIDQTLSNCHGQLHTGYCPGPTNVRCCTE
jgi:hypothetical protein